MLIGHQQQWQFLKKSIETKKISHAYLFIGQEKLGKKTLAKSWASLLLGAKDKDNYALSNLILLEPANQEIKIAQIRDLIWQLSLKPLEQSKRVAIIDNAHLMNQEAQTCLLKTLEEPKGNSVLILITDKPVSLLPTILSRVQIIKFKPIKKEEIKKYLLTQGLNEKEAEEISQISLGRPGRAIDFLLNKQRRADFYQKIKEINNLIDAPLVNRFQYVKKLIQEETEVLNILDIWLNYFRAKLICQTSNGKNQTDFNQISLKKLKKLLEKIQETKILISTTNINSQLALENLMLEF
ncbi:MAG: hypothetical protein ACPLW9_00255 [Minisyncoccales bacterium]